MMTEKEVEVLIYKVLQKVILTDAEIYKTARQLSGIFGMSEPNIRRILKEMDNEGLCISPNPHVCNVHLKATPYDFDRFLKDKALEYYNM